jgi:peroxiredoxin
MAVLRQYVLGLLVAITAGLLGACALLAARIINPPPIDPLDLEFQAYLGDPAPLFELPGLDGQTVSNAGLAGRAYVLFWGDPDCKACREVYPQLKRVAEKIPTLMVAVGNRTAIAESRSEHGMVFPVAFDSLRETLADFHVSGLPTAMLVDGHGRIKRAASGNIMTPCVLALVGRDLR